MSILPPPHPNLTFTRIFLFLPKTLFAGKDKILDKDKYHPLGKSEKNISFLRQKI